MFEIEFAIFAAIVFVFALVSRRVERLNVTAPMAFIAAGVLFGASHVTSSALNTDALLLVGSIALVLVLFTDASRINISLFRVNANLPARLLIIGLPLTIAAGAVIATLLFTNLTIWQAAIIGAVLAPTDAGLGQAIVTSERVPVRIPRDSDSQRLRARHFRPTWSGAICTQGGCNGLRCSRVARRFTTAARKRRMISR